MNFDEYQQAITRFAVYSRDNELMMLSYLALGLNGEAGEVAEQIKKAIRNDSEITPERRQKIFDELGDVLWYAARMASELGFSFAEIAAANVHKLEQRRVSNNLKHE